MRKTPLALALALVGCASIAACGGGGGSTPPAPVPSIPGGGFSPALDQKIALSVTLPAIQAGVLSKKSRLSTSRARQAIATTPYLSPLTGSIVLSLALVDQKALNPVPPPISPINPNTYCAPTSAGCTFTTPANIPAAKGVNEYVVQTYSGLNGTGNLISTGFIDVTVPSQNAQLPTGSLSIGGYVASIALGSAAPLTFMAGQPSTAGILIQAFDSAGAAIVGNALYATPISLSISDVQDFALPGAPAQFSQPGPIITPIPLVYNGNSSLSGTATLTASTTNENGAVATAAPLVASIVGTPPPTPQPSTNYSLYVDVTDVDMIQEFDVVKAIENGNIPAPNVAPRRMIQVATPAPTASGVGAGFTCSSYSGVYPLTSTGQGTNGLAVAAGGTIYINPSCQDAAGNQYVFGLAANARGLTQPTILDKYNPSALNQGFSTLAAGASMSLDPAPGGLVYASDGNLAFGSEFGFTQEVSNPSASQAIGYTCYAPIPLTPPYCTTNAGSLVVAAESPAVSSGFVFVTGEYTTLTTPPGNYAPNANAIAIAPAVDTISQGGIALTKSAIAGPSTDLDVNGPDSDAVAVDGTTLYVLHYVTNVNSLSGCASPAANLVFNALTTDMCADAQPFMPQTHYYLVAYSLTSQIINANGNIDVPPIFGIGGDKVGRFGVSVGGGFSGQYIAVHNGFVYILNDYPSFSNFSYSFNPEIDVYDTRALTGLHTDIAPVARLTYSAMNAHVPTAIFIGPTGPASSVGGAEVLRNPRPQAKGGSRRNAARLRSPLFRQIRRGTHW